MIAAIRHIALLALVAGPALAATDQVAVPEAIRADTSALLAVDQHRATVIDRIVAQWGEPLVQSRSGVDAQQLRVMLAGLRADHLLAASLAGTLDGLRHVLAIADASAASVNALPTKTLGDNADDVVYTPVTPCRLVETRGTFAAVFQGGGAFGGNEVRNYTIQGGNGVCLSQLPAGLNPSAIQLQVFGIPINSGANGDVEILPQGSSFGSTATLVYLGNILFTSASTTALINLANNQIGVQVRGGGAHVAIDVVGYFKAPSGLNFFAQGGNTFGATAKLGTLDNRPLEIYVNNQRVMRYESGVSPSITGGHPNNTATGEGAIVAGGGTAGTCFFSGSSRPCVNLATERGASVGGGFANIANGQNSVIAGGYLNTAMGQSNTVGGGSNNTTSTAFQSTVGGGTSNTASGDSSTVAGGFGNVASGSNSAVAGGDLNIASGSGSAVPGGSNNTASGVNSFAAGNRAKAVTNGTFVFGDSTNADVTSTADHQFIVAVSNNIIMAKNKSLSAGCFMPGSTWSCTSDRNMKRDFADVDARGILQKVAAMPISSWRYEDEPNAIRHIGPMSQDFHSAFGLGHDDKTIAMVDADGIALAAIQGLHRELMERDKEIAELRRQLKLISLRLGIE
jgi:endosialidase-like protein